MTLYIHNMPVKHTKEEYSWPAKFTKEEQLACAFTWKERVLYYIVHPSYFLQVMSHSILNWVWKF
jgi:hypothetical protein